MRTVLAALVATDTMVGLTQLGNTAVIPYEECLTGFAVKGREHSYLLLFREVTERDTLELDLGNDVELLRTVISNAEVSASVCNGRASVTLSKPRAYALLEMDFKG